MLLTTMVGYYFSLFLNIYLGRRVKKNNSVLIKFRKC